MISVILLLMSGVIHFTQFGRPSSVVFDEVFYGSFANSYWQGQYFFDLHPPFAKILFAFVGKLFEMDRYIVDWSTIGNSLPISIVGLRLLPTLAGLILPIIIYLLCRSFDLSKTSSFIAGALVCFENSLVVQSRYLLPDVIMLTFGFASILLYQEYKKRFMMQKSSWFLGLSTIFAGISLSIKWTGLTFLFIILILELLRQYFYKNNPKTFIKSILLFSFKYVFVASLIYLSLFAIHFSVLSQSGPGNVFMSPGFQSTLQNNSVGSTQSEPNFWQKIIELNKVMFTSSSGMTATHSNASKWYTWPIMTRSIFYWQGQIDSNGVNSYIYLLGNPFVYWLGSITILFTIIYSIYKIVFNRLSNIDPDKVVSMTFLVVGYLSNLLPYALISRVMFLYHYETALVISIIAIAYWLDALQPNIKKYASVIILITTISAFIFWSPLTYGTPIDQQQLKIRMWLPGWR